MIVKSDTIEHTVTAIRCSIFCWFACELVDNRNEKTGKKIRDAELSKIPYMIVVGEKEENTQTLSLRKHGHGDMGTFSIQDFADLVKDEIDKAMNQ